MYVRVAISQKFDEVLFQFPTRIIAKIMVENTTVVAFLVDFVGNLYTYNMKGAFLRVSGLDVYYQRFGSLSLRLSSTMLL